MLGIKPIEQQIHPSVSDPNIITIDIDNTNDFNSDCEEESSKSLSIHEKIKRTREHLKSSLTSHIWNEQHEYKIRQTPSIDRSESDEEQTTHSDDDTSDDEMYNTSNYKITKYPDGQVSEKVNGSVVENKSQEDIKEEE